VEFITAHAGERYAAPFGTTGVKVSVLVAVADTVAVTNGVLLAGNVTVGLAVTLC
jgi:hypothetical protein